MKTGKKAISKASKIESILVVAMLVAVVFSIVLVPVVNPTTMTNNGAPASYVKRSDTDKLVMNFTITTQTDIKLAGKHPSDGQILETSGQASDWGNSSVGTSIILCYNPVGPGQYNWRTDCIWKENASNPNTNYNSIDTILNGTAPLENTVYSWLGCRAPTWTTIKTYDAVNGGWWDASTDAIINESGDNNNCWLDKLNAVTVNLSSTCNATNSDISAVSLWVESNAQTGFQSGDTRLKTVTSGTSWNLTGITQTINTSATFYVTVNISGTASHYKTIKMEIPALYDANSNGGYNAGDRGLFLASTDDTGSKTNTNFLTIDAFAPVTNASAISGYWKKLSQNPLNITATASDNLSGIASVTLYYRNSTDNSTWTGPWTFGTDTSAPYYWSTFNFPNGSGYYRFYSRGTDNVGNVEAAPVVNDTICGYDNTTPSSTITIPTNSGNYNALTNITGAAADTFSSVSSVTITIYNSTNSKYWNGTAWGSSASNLATTGTTSWYRNSVSGLPAWSSAKTYIINSTATDKAGNTETSPHSHSFTYDTDVPTGSISIPVHNTWYNAMTNITGTAADTGNSGVVQVRISIYNSTTGGKYYTGTAWSGSLAWIPVTGTSSWYRNSVSGLPTWTNGSTYIVNLSVKDNANNYDNASDSNRFYIDTDKPVSRVTAISGYWKTSQPLIISYTANENGSGSGLKNVTLYYYYSSTNTTFTGPAVFGIDADPWTTNSFSFTFPSTSGYYRFYTRAADNATNVEAAPVANDTICGYDVVNPTATITLPTNGGYYKAGSTIDSNITGSSYDVQGVVLVNFTIYNVTDGKYWSGTAWQTPTANLTANKTSEIPTTHWYYNHSKSMPAWGTNKVYRINVSARDSAGNWNRSAATASFTYDTTAPTITDITAPITGTWYHALTNITGTASDAMGLSLVNITIYNSTGHKYWNGATWSAVVVNFTTTGTSTWYKNSGLPSIWVNGSTYIVNATAKDNAGNVGAKHSHTFYMDLVAPGSQVTAISGYWKTTSPLAITYTANNSGSGLHYVRLFYRYGTDNSTWGGWVTSSDNTYNDTDPWVTKQWSFDFTANGSGYYQFYSRAADNVSNLEAAPVAKDAYCGYDAANPTVTITVPTNSTTYNTMNLISGTCADTGYSGIKSVNLTIYNTTSHKYWNGTSHAWESGVRWVSSTIAPGYVNWSYGSSLVTWKDHITYWVNATSKDNATRTSAAHWHIFTFDTTSPTCAIAYNRSATYFKAGTLLKIYANFTTPVGLDETTVKINISTFGDGDLLNTSMSRTNNTRWYYSWTIPSGSDEDGVFTVKIYGRDNATNYLNPYPTTSGTKKIDNTVPTSAVTSISTYWKTSAPVTIAATANDGGSGLASVTLYYYYSADNSSFAGPIFFGTNTSPWVGVQWSFTFPSGNGFYRLYSRATDNATLTEAAPVSNDTQCGFDNIAPTSSVDAISPYWKTSSPITVTASATDATSQVKNITLYYRFSSDNSSWGATWLPVGKDSVSPWSWSVILTNNSGYYQFYTRANDTATNREAALGAADAIAGYDHTAPSCTIAYNTTRTWFKEGMKLKIYANFTESGSGMNENSIYISIATNGNGGLVNTSMTRSNNTRWYYNSTIPGGSDDDGTATVRIWAADNATNNLATYPTTSATKKIDNTVPTVTIAYNNARTYFKAGESLRIYANFTGGNPSGLDETSINIWIDTQGNGGVDNTSMSRTNHTKWYYDWTIPSGSNDGVVTINIKAKDNATNNLSPYPTSSATKRIDNTRPTATLAFNNARTYYTYVDTVRIYANFTEAGSGIDLTSVIINISTLGNGDMYNTTMTETNGLLWYYDWNVPSGTDEDGTVTIKLYAKDNATNLLNPWSTNNTAKKIDNAAPTCTIAYNNTNTYYKAGAKLKIYANFTDVGSGMDESSIRISIATAGNGGLANTSMSRTNNTRWYYSWTVPVGSDDDGVATVKIWAIDNATYPLNPYPTNSAIKIIDNTVPSLSYAVLDADNDGTNYTYVDVYFSETTMDTTTELYTDFNVSKSGVGVAAIQTKSGNLVTLRCNRTFQTNDSPTIGIPGSVADLAGNTLTSVTITINTYRISIRSGWNLISVPADPHTTLLSTVLSSITANMAIIWGYNASANTWSSWIPTDGDTMRLYPGKGYWVWMRTADTLIGNYNLLPTGPTSPPSVTLAGQKWNLIGQWRSYNQSASTSPGGGLASLSDSDIGSLFQFTGTGYVNIWNGHQNMVPGQGFWMWKITSGDKQYTPS